MRTLLLATAALLLATTACISPGDGYYGYGEPLYDTATDSGTVIERSECIGAVVNYRCHGTYIDAGKYRPTCYGTMIGGRCTGPMF